ncbi:MAG: 5-(carboxyamino)imidazole ribonucleotide synthase [Neisseriaceae bacterium]|nr:MAG: 5-(carboxyamino)imidazole ribonucleotide synthase [Neisseriaceae bacterium]
MKQAMILPPATIGILGGGQLGMYLALAAKQFGYKVVVLEPDPLCPAKRAADIHICKKYDDQKALEELAQHADVITTEFENVPASTVDYLNQFKPVYPQANSLLIAQNRGKEKSFFRSCGLLTAGFVLISHIQDCHNVKTEMFPAILKTTTMGYDGKGQVKVMQASQLEDAYIQLAHPECILEKMVSLQHEVSVIVARNQTGSNTFPVIENHHRNGILDISYIPAAIAPELIIQAEQAAHLLAEKLDYIGLLTIEFFITTDGKLLVNEIAPRPHNSGHITLDTSLTSQFEQQLRAVCGLNLGSTVLKKNGAMLNLLGDVWLDPALNPFEIMINEHPDTKLYLYGKTQAKSGRKMGHLNICNDSRKKLEEQIKQLKNSLKIDDL